MVIGIVQVKYCSLQEALPEKQDYGCCLSPQSPLIKGFILQQAPALQMVVSLQIFDIK